MGVSFLVTALHDQRVHAGPRTWLAEALERHCIGLQMPAKELLPGTPSSARRIACARAYMASQRLILSNAAGYLRALSEREAAELFTLPSSLTSSEAEEHLVVEDRRPLRLVFAEDDAADSDDGGNEDEQVSEEDSSDGDATGSSSSKSEPGSDDDTDGGLPPQDLEHAIRDAGAPESVPRLSDDGEVVNTTADDEAEKNFVLFGDGCTIRVAFATA